MHVLLIPTPLLTAECQLLKEVSYPNTNFQTVARAKCVPKVP